MTKGIQEVALNLLSDTYGYNLELQIEEQIKKGTLPKDLFLKLSVIGAQKIDQKSGKLLRPILLEELLSHATIGSPLGELTGQMLRSPIPDVIFNFKDYSRDELNDLAPIDEGPFYTKEDLALVIQDRRRTENIVIESWEDPANGGHRYSEVSLSRKLAHAVWRAILTRTRPGWVKNTGVQEFWEPKISTTQNGTRMRIILDAAYKQMRRELVSRAMFSDGLILEILQEAESSGVRGLGKIAIHDIESLLGEQHPELQPH